MKSEQDNWTEAVKNAASGYGAVVIVGAGAGV